jgi:hypothetical protein
LRKVNERFGLLLLQPFPVGCGLSIGMIYRIGSEVVTGYSVILCRREVAGANSEGGDWKSPVK